VCGLTCFKCTYTRPRRRRRRKDKTLPLLLAAAAVRPTLLINIIFLCLQILFLFRRNNVYNFEKVFPQAGLVASSTPASDRTAKFAAKLLAFESERENNQSISAHVFVSYAVAALTDMCFCNKPTRHEVLKIKTTEGNLRERE
jgi:hypothetical protein